MPDTLRISFEGAARTVTGSRHRIAWGARTLLFDCGLFQGHRQEADRVNRSFRFEPQSIDTVVLSHAHLDHSGNLPTLVHRGYAGRIHATPATAELCHPMLADSAFLMARDLEHVRKHRHDRGANGNGNGTPPLEPLYTPEDVETVVQRFETHAYHETWSPLPGVTAAYYDAGHILGSAVTTLEFRDGDQVFRLGMSGDLGRPDRPILQDPETPPGMDALVLESTYGNRLHPDGAESDRALAEILTRTAARGGRVLVPAFAVGRAQEIVATIHELVQAKRAPDLPIYVDSPLAAKATDVFRHHPELFDDAARTSFEQHGGEPLGFARLRYTHSAEESRALNELEGSCIIVSASGMCEGGRILHHLLHGLGDPRNTVMLVGFQAEGTLGRRLQDGAEVVSIFGEPVRRRAEVAMLSGYSAHADQHELVTWVGGLNPRPRRVFLVHGEMDAAGVLAEKLHDSFGMDVVVPGTGESYRLWN